MESPRFRAHKLADCRYHCLCVLSRLASTDMAAVEVSVSAAAVPGQNNDLTVQ